MGNSGRRIDSLITQECFTELLRRIIKEVEGLRLFAPSDKVCNPLVRARYELDDALTNAQEGVFYTHVNWGDAVVTADELIHGPSTSSSGQDVNGGDLQKKEKGKEELVHVSKKQRIAVVDMPISELTAAEVADGQRLLAKAKLIYVEERDVLRSLPVYAKAAAAGNVDAFMELSEIFEEEGNGDAIQIEMVHVLQRVVFPHRVAERDIEFVKNFLCSKIKDMSMLDVKKLLHIAQYYDILQDCVEGQMEWIQNCNDAINDDGGMFPDGHDDGEAIDAMRCDY